MESTGRPLSSILEDPDRELQWLMRSVSGPDNGLRRTSGVRSYMGNGSGMLQRYHEVRIADDDGGADMKISSLKLRKALKRRFKYLHHTTSVLSSAFADEELHSTDLPGAVSDQDLLAFNPSTPRPIRRPSGGGGLHRTMTLATLVGPAEFPDGQQHAMQVDGVIRFVGQQDEDIPRSYRAYAKDVEFVTSMLEDGPCRSACRSRLQILDLKGDIYRLLNTEMEDSNRDARGDVHSTMKVDNSVRLSTAMDARTLLEFIQDKCATSGDDVVQMKDGEDVTLAAFMRSAGLHPASKLNIDMLGLQPKPTKRFHRFDIFSQAFSRGGVGSVQLMLLFLKSRTGPPLHGRYFGELLRDLSRRNESEPNVRWEYKVPIFGTQESEWRDLAHWLTQYNLLTPNVRYVIQIPRILDIRNHGIYHCETLQDQLCHIFRPLFDATLQPHRHPQLADLLSKVSALNVISDEVAVGQQLPAHRPPHEWPWCENPPDLLFNYYLWANLQSLNALRRSRGLSTMQYRPNAGETGHLENLVSSFLMADSIIHGLRLKDSPVLQYLYYITQIGVCMSPISNNGLYLPYQDNPFPAFCNRGLRVSLGTDDPLYFHSSTRPLTQEYTTAGLMYTLTDVDLREVARNSVLISNFPEDFRREHIRRVVPAMRLHFRALTLHAELTLLRATVTAHDSIKEALRRPVQAPSPVPGSALSDPNDLPLHCGSCAHDVHISQISVEETCDVCRRRDAVSEWGYHCKNTDCSGWVCCTACAEYVRRALRENVATYHKVDIWGPRDTQQSMQVAIGLLQEAVELRAQYRWRPDILKPRTAGGGHRPPAGASAMEEYTCSMPDGVLVIRRAGSAFTNPLAGQSGEAVYAVPHTLDAFIDHYTRLVEICNSPAVKEFAYKRLQLLELKFELHNALNAQRSGEDPDFYECIKVDTHVHMSAGMTARQLLEFLREKGMKHAGDVVAVVTDPLEVSEPPPNLPGEEVPPPPSVPVPFAVPNSFDHIVEGGEDKDKAAASKPNDTMRLEDVPSLSDPFPRAHSVSFRPPPIVVGHTPLRHSDSAQFDAPSWVLSPEGREVPAPPRPAPSRHARTVTFGEFLERHQIDPQHLNVAKLGVLADPQMYERFDKFKGSYNVAHSPELRSLVMRHANFVQGRYFAELIKHRVFRRMEEDGSTYAENRLPLAGKTPHEWDGLARWFHHQGLESKHNKWLVQVPRAYHDHRRHGRVESFQQLLENLFLPLFRVSQNRAENPILDHFLTHVGGFDCVDNEDEFDQTLQARPPYKWVTASKPPYAYWMYFLWANISVLNRFRADRGLCTFSFRPHCGEAGDPHHLLAAFLTADGINHGINARKNEAIEYLYYLTQTGMAISPLSNNVLFLEYSENPFPVFFRRGLSVSLSTDDPLQFHHTQDPLLEEYIIASKMWKLGVEDLTEIASNSVRHSDFPSEVKEEWHGRWWALRSSEGNDPTKSHVSNARVEYRFETYHDEIDFLEKTHSEGGKGWFRRAFLTSQQERSLIVSQTRFPLGVPSAGTSLGDSPRHGPSTHSEVHSMQVKLDALRRKEVQWKEERARLTEQLSRVQHSFHPPLEADTGTTAPPAVPAPQDTSPGCCVLQ